MSRLNHRKMENNNKRTQNQQYKEYIMADEERQIRISIKKAEQFVEEQRRRDYVAKGLTKQEEILLKA